MKKVIVIGGGPAGLMAAAAAAIQGAETMILEKKPQLGTKLAITGKGRCNVTTALPMDEQLQHYPRNGKFLYSALNQFSSQNLIELLQQQGCPTKIERGARVFPQSDRAKDVVSAMVNFARQAGVRFLLNTPVEKLQKRGDRFIIYSAHQKLEADAVVIATGGLSYPGTGSTGDGYRWGETFGHTIVSVRPGLIPLVVDEPWVRDLQGLSLRNVSLMAYGEKKLINRDFGEMLFTHFGISGPIVLSMSRDIVEYMAVSGQKVRMVLDLKPALNENVLEQRILRDLAKHANKQIDNALHDLLPSKMINAIIQASELPGDKPCHQITKEERQRLMRALKSLTFTVSKWRPIEEAIVTTGGIAVKEINPGTMESKLVQGLFWAGEVIDVDGYTGGFNLQSAWSTGWVAGTHAV